MDILHKILNEKKSIICQKWLQEIYKYDKLDPSNEIYVTNDRFTNPIRYILSKELPSLYENVVLLNNVEATRDSLTNIIRIRSVQNLTPAKVVNFIFLLKRTLMNELSELNVNLYDNQELADLDSLIDSCALLAFNLYCAQREVIYGITIKEIKAERDNAMLIFERIDPTNRIKGK